MACEWAPRKGRAGWPRDAPLTSGDPRPARSGPRWVLPRSPAGKCPCGLGVSLELSAWRGSSGLYFPISFHTSVQSLISIIPPYSKHSWGNPEDAGGPPTEEGHAARLASVSTNQERVPLSSYAAPKLWCKDTTLPPKHTHPSELGSTLLAPTKGGRGPRGPDTSQVCTPPLPPPPASFPAGAVSRGLSLCVCPEGQTLPRSLGWWTGF